MQSLNSTSRWVTRCLAAGCLMLLMSLGAIGQEQPAGGSPDAPSGPAPVPAVRQADNLAVITIEGG
ncbi:MAG: hypothetical protein ACIAQF_12080, partial [Phycisphaerales bacterium JB065]